MNGFSGLAKNRIAPHSNPPRVANSRPLLVGTTIVAMDSDAVARRARFAIERSEVDGVRVFSGNVPGQMQCMLAFRVGVADESVPTRGITHVVEHLAMYSVMQSLGAGDRYNARVEPLRTRFVAKGESDDIVAFLRQVTSNLASLPADRLAHEMRVLRTEAANRDHGSVKWKWIYRFGAQGLGLVDYEEFGLRWLGPDAVLDWASRWFTAGNAVLWLSKPIPDGLVLNLPAGAAGELPEAKPLPYVTPAVYHVGDRWVSLSMLTSRVPALALGTRIFDNELRQLLRRDNPIAYNVNAIAERIDRSTGEITAFADSLQANSRQAADAIVGAVRRLAGSGPTAEELEAVKLNWRRTLADPEAPLGLLDAVALAELDGVEPRMIDQADAEVEDVTAEDVAHVFGEGMKAAFLALPFETKDDLEGFTPVPSGGGERADGVAVTIRPGVAKRDIINYSEDGISMTHDNGVVVGMRWEDIAGALWWAAGRIVLLGPDGSTLNVEPRNGATRRACTPRFGARSQATGGCRWTIRTQMRRRSLNRLGRCSSSVRPDSVA